MAGHSAENIAVNRNIVKLVEAISANTDVFNKVMLACVQQELITQSFMNELRTTSDTSLSTKATHFISSMQAVLKHDPSYLDNFLTVLVKYGDPCCKEVATKIANEYNGSDQLLPNYKQAIIDKRNTISIKMIIEDDETDDTRSFFQLLLEAKDILIVLLRRLKNGVNYIIEKYRSRLFFSICIFFILILYVFRLPFSTILPYAYLFHVCTVVQRMHIKELLIYGLVLTPGAFILDFNYPTDVQISHSIIGGRPESINWLEEGFKMDIFPDSFPPDVPVHITISTHQSSYSKFQLATQMYTITSTSPSSGIVLVHLKHNLALYDTNMNRFLLLFKHTTNYQAKLLDLHNLSRDFLTSQIQIKSSHNTVCGVLNYTALANKTYHQVYRISFYEKEVTDYIFIVAAVTFPGDKSSDSKYSRWKKVSKSPYEVSVLIGSNITVKSSGCWNSGKYTQTITKGEYLFQIEWKCLWWPIDTFITVDNSNSGINVSISTNAESGYNSIVCLTNSFIGKLSEFFYNFLITLVFAYFLSWFYFKDMNLTDMCICCIFTVCHKWFEVSSYRFFYYRFNKNHILASIFCTYFTYALILLYLFCRHINYIVDLILYT